MNSIRRATPKTGSSALGKAISNAGLRSTTWDVHEISEWPRLRSRWEELSQASPYTSFFLDSAWVNAWIETFSARVTPRILLVQQDDLIVGACIVVARTARRGPFVNRIIFLNTAGENPGDDTCTEYNSLLCRAGWEAETAHCVREYLDTQQWDQFVANGVATDTAIAALQCELRSTVMTHRARPSYYVDLDELRRRGVTYENAIARGMRKQIRHNIRQYLEQGDLRVHIATSLQEADVMMHQLTELHQESWRLRGQPGAFSSTAFTAFHRMLVREAWPLGHILLVRISAGSQTVGVLYNFVRSGKIYFYQSGLAFNPDHRIKPGFVSLALAIQAFTDEGYSEFDFLAGDSHYKKLLTTNSRTLNWLVFHKVTPKYQAIELLRSGRAAWHFLANKWIIKARSKQPDEDLVETRIYPFVEWEHIKVEWTTLVRGAQQSSFFLDCSWVESWLEIFGPELHPKIVMFVRSGKVIGGCILVERRVRRGPFVITRIYLNTAGEHQADDTCMEYNTLLCLPNEHHAVAKAFRTLLGDRGWDELILNAMMVGPMLDAIKAVFTVYTMRTTVRPDYYINLARIRHTVGAYVQSLGKNTRRHLRRNIEAYGKLGELRCEVAEDYESSLRFIDELAELHQISWRKRGQSGVFGSKRFWDFHQKLISRAHAAGEIRVIRVRAGGYTIGVLYMFIRHGKVYFYQSGLCYDQPGLSPGLVTHVFATLRHLEDGLRECDFLAGDGQHKRSLSTDERSLYWVVIQRSNAKGKIIELLRRYRTILLKPITSVDRAM